MMVASASESCSDRDASGKTLPAVGMEGKRGKARRAITRAKDAKTTQLSDLLLEATSAAANVGDTLADRLVCAVPGISAAMDSSRILQTGDLARRNLAMHATRQDAPISKLSDVDAKRLQRAGKQKMQQRLVRLFDLNADDNVESAAVADLAEAIMGHGSRVTALEEQMATLTVELRTIVMQTSIAWAAWPCA